MNNNNKNNIKRKNNSLNNRQRRKYGKLMVDYLFNRLNKTQLPRDPMEFRKMPSEQVVSKLEDFHTKTRAQYLYSMIHPDYAVTEGVQVKMYSDVPVPTSSIGIRTMYQLTTSQLGTFLLSWSPNMLATDPGIESHFPGVPHDTVGYSNIRVCTSNLLSGANPQDGLLSYALPAYRPQVLLQKYRLVSAIIKVKYNGSVLNQAGTMISCATFDNLPVDVVIAATSATSAEDIMTNPSISAQSLEFNRYADFSLIRNGLWNYSQNIAADANGLECLYVPTDPTSLMFYDLGSYYGSQLTTEVENKSAGSTVGQTRQIIGDSGAQLSYIVAGHNMPKNETCIQVEVYANYEVIADPTTAPLLRSAINSTFDWNDSRRMKDFFKELSQKGFIRKAFDYVKEKFPAFAKATINWGPRLMPLVSKLLF